MTIRYSSLLVVLAHDIREDDAQPLIDAIRQLKGVLRVTGNVSDPHEAVAQIRAFSDIRQRLLESLYEGHNHDQ